MPGNRSTDKNPQTNPLFGGGLLRSALVSGFLVGILLLINRFEVRMYEWAKYLTQEGEFLATFVYFGLVNVNIIILLFLFFIIFRNIAKLIIERKRGVFGSQLRLKLVTSLVLFSVIPSLLFFYLSYSFLTSSMDRWFSTKIKETIVETRNLSEQAFENERKQVLSLASIAAEKINIYSSSEYLRLSSTKKFGLTRVSPGENGFRYYVDWSALTSLKQRFALHDVVSVDKDLQNLWPLGLKVAPNTADSGDKAPDTDKASLVESFRKKVKAGTAELPKTPEPFTHGVGIEGQDFLLGFAPVFYAGASAGLGGDLLAYVVVQRKLKTGILQSLDKIQKEFASLRPSAKYIKLSYRVLLGLMTLIVLFSAVWAGFYVARNITYPIRRLALATKQIAAGNYAVQIPKIAHDETGVLVDSFNHMAKNLDQQKKEIEQSQKELEERGKFTKTVLANVGSGVVSVDSQGNVSSVNNAVFELLNKKPEVIEGKNIASSLGQEFAGLVWRPAEKKLEKADQVTFEVPYKDDHGNKINLGVYAVTLKDDLDRQIGLVIVFDDVTYQANLQRVAAWKEVARRVAHEIKNPLTPIRLNAERALRKFSAEIKPSDKATFDECMQSILSNVDQLTEIVEEFRKFARMPSGKLQSCDLSFELLAVVDNFRLSHPGVAFDVGNVKPGHMVLADKGQMRQVFVNLINNALDAMSSLDQPSLAVRLRRRSNLSGYSVIIEFEDNGIGIPEGQRAQVFEPYYTTRKEGTGLGLAIVNRIINEHGGEIRILDGSGSRASSAGVCFEISFPEVS